MWTLFAIMVGDKYTRSLGAPESHMINNRYGGQKLRLTDWWLSPFLRR